MKRLIVSYQGDPVPAIDERIAITLNKFEYHEVGRTETQGQRELEFKKREGENE